MGVALKRIVVLIIGILMVIPAAFVAMQDAPPPLKLQITGINQTAYPTVVVNANVFDHIGQPILGLGIENFAVVGQIVDNMKVVKVENVTDDSLSFAVVLAIDTSGSMTGTPIERTIEAAKSFINAIGPNDPVAIVTFDNRARLVQDYTTDKAVLTNTINNLRYGGETALYDGGALAVQTAANSPVPRRAVIILSDGQEYRASLGERGSGLTAALQQGVPVYTIGEGFGFDRTYMTTLADGTNAQFYESPDPNQLNEIYNTLARTLRSQYIITLTTDLPGDGQTYQLGLQVTDAEGATAEATTDFKTRIYQPIVSLPDLPADPIAEPTVVTAEALSDDGIASATFQLNDEAPVAVESPYEFTIDPAALSSGENSLTFSATDSNGDTTSVTGTFLVALKPPTVEITGVGDTVDTVTTVTITGASVEGPIQGLIVKVNDALVASSLNEASTTVTLDPAALPPGDNTLTAIVRDAAGGRVEQTITFSVPALPPTVELTGITAGESLTENRTVTVNVTSPQTAVTSVVYTVDGKELANQTEEPFTFDLDVAAIGVGNHILTVEATNEGGQSGKADVAFVITPPPTATPTATNTNTPIPPTATDTKVPPTNTTVPPTATNTTVPATATDTTVPPTATNTTEAATAAASPTTASQANVATNTSEPATAAAIAPTDTKVPPTDTIAPPTSTSTATTEATQEVTAEVTEAATAEITEATAEVTEASTAEVTAETTEAAAPAATNTTAATSTKEATAAATNAAQGEPTFTPIPLTAENQSVVGQAQSPLLIGATCLLGLLLLAIVYWLAARMRKSR